MNNLNGGENVKNKVFPVNTFSGLLLENQFWELEDLKLWVDSFVYNIVGL